jgi:hypothetical protein
MRRGLNAEGSVVKTVMHNPICRNRVVPTCAGIQGDRAAAAETLDPRFREDEQRAQPGFRLAAGSSLALTTEAPLQRIFAP